MSPACPREDPQRRPIECRICLKFLGPFNGTTIAEFEFGN
jgi:hypothetical protein